MDNLVKHTIFTNSISRRHRLQWALVGMLLLLVAVFFAGCGGGSAGGPIAPLNPTAFDSLGKEMAAIERLPADQLNAVSRLTPAKIELIEALKPEQLANIVKLKDADMASITLGSKTSVVADLTPAQTSFIVNLENLPANVTDAISNLSQNRLNAQDILAGKAGNAIKQERSAYAYYWQGYIAETLAFSDPNKYFNASTFYQQAIAIGGGYGAQARYRIGVLGVNNKIGVDSLNTAKVNLQVVGQYRKKPIGGSEEIRLWLRNPVLAAQGGAASVGTMSGTSAGPVFFSEEAPAAAAAELDAMYKKSPGLDGNYYRIVSAYVTFFKKLSPFFGAALALIFLALIVKLVTIPLTTASFRGMRDMQRVQPLIKQLQEKYKDDKQTLAAEQMKLMKEHNVSPLGGCLPMLIQLPIFIVVYRAVQVYSAGFADSHFLWIQNLARPDFTLLILYAISMVITQKLTATPATDPQQKMMQSQMTYFMPIFLLFVLMGIASAFVLYWFFLNIFSSLHQYWLIQKFKKEDEAKGIVQPALAPEPKKSGSGTKKGKKR